MKLEENALLRAFLAHPQLQSRVLTVLTRLPETIKADFGDDPLFQITLEDYSPE
jgi:hypothetical protein